MSQSESGLTEMIFILIIIITEQKQEKRQQHSDMRPQSQYQPQMQPHDPLQIGSKLIQDVTPMKVSMKTPSCYWRCRTLVAMMVLVNVYRLFFLADL